MRRNAVPEALSQDASRNSVPELFFPAIDITRLGVACYPTALLSNKLAQRPLKFQRVTANNSLDFVQSLKKKKEFWVTLCFPEPIFFFPPRKIALDRPMYHCSYATKELNDLLIC
jgi:hypothetical protein